jgi:hypothetical protein
MTQLRLQMHLQLMLRHHLHRNYNVSLAAKHISILDG